MPHGTILLIDDDQKLTDLVGEYLGRQEWQTLKAHTPEDGIRLVREIAPRLVILDVMLPGKNGFETCREIRTFSSVPVIMLTARGEVTDRVVGLEVGADDYLPKPFEPRELLARIRAILRRRADGTQPSGSSRLRFGSLEIDRDARSVSVAGAACELTAYQFDLLLALAERAGRVLTRDQIMEAVRGRELDAFDRSIDVHMGRIRAAIESDVKNPKRILTVRGVGYVFAKQQD